jgi:predicted TIM-barrel fold metal-dependent hydrolase
MTRRELLAAAAVGASAASFERIDTHTHIHRHAPALLESLAKGGWRGLSICDSRAVGDQPSDLEEMIRGTAEANRQSNGRLTWATTFDAREFEKPDFTGRAIAGLQQGFKQGAIAAKIWKNIGMGIRSKSGEHLLADHPALLPIYEATQKAGKTLIAHLGDPNAAWLRGAQAAGKDAILAARDRVLSRFPRLRVVGCHLGSHEEDLDGLARRLEAFPNFAVDLASRVRYLAAGDRDKVRQFLLQYQDRILYGTDFTLGSGDDARAAQSFETTHDREWSFLAASAPSAWRDRQVPGLALPETALRQIFRDNAVRWLPGIVA